MAQQQRAVVVDDDMDTCEVLRSVLEDAGYAVEHAVDGVAALDMLQVSAPPAVVVLDLDLPRLDGLGVMRAVMGDPRLALCYTFVLLTAVSATRYEVAARECMAHGVPFITKPFEIDDLIAAVDGAAHHLPSP